MDYIVLFDVASKPRPWFDLLVLLAFIAGCFVFGRLPLLRVLRGSDSEFGRWANLVLTRMGMVLGLFALIVSTWSYETNRKRWMTDLAHGDVSVVEGVISSVTKQYRGRRECFTVESRSFCYVSNKVTPAFNQTAGPIRQGLRVRVSYQGEDILRLETATSASDRTNANALRK